jgi:sec-independent protein translocase protein TatB
MPQIGWFEILIIVILAILIIGPKDFPIMLNKLGSWVSSFKNYFKDVQKDYLNAENIFDDEMSLKDNPIDTTKNKKKDEL